MVNKKHEGREDPRAFIGSFGGEEKQKNWIPKLSHPRTRGRGMDVKKNLDLGERAR